MTDAESPVVAIDGPSGVGKSTTAKQLAAELGVPYLDTGAMYRAIGLEVLRCGVDPDDERAVVAVVDSADLELRREGGEFVILIGGEAIGGQIRSPEVSEATSKISRFAAVRQRLVELQRQIAGEGGAVVEGRDIGTVVFPDSRFKFFLDAPKDVRLRRRLEQLHARGRQLGEAELVQELEARDDRDRGRSVSPLVQDESYVVLDTSRGSAEEIVAAMLDHIRSAAS